MLKDYLGVFKDEVNQNKISEAIGKCAELAFDKSYRFFALGDNGRCRSGQNAKEEYFIKGSTSETNCPKGIGVYRRISVYTFGRCL